MKEKKRLNVFDDNDIEKRQCEKFYGKLVILDESSIKMKILI